MSNQQSWVDIAMQEAWPIAAKIIAERQRVENFSKYKDDPVGFCRDVFGEYYTDDTINVAESVRDNIITIAKSANATGKTFMAARIALWFFSVYPDSKIYMAAAPPLENLRQILWGELITAARKRPSILAGCKLKSGNQLIVQRGPDNFIAGVAIPTSGSAEEREAKFSGRHAPHLMFIIDEGDAVPDEVYRGIDSCMSGGELVRLLIMFNPRGKYGPVYYKESKGLANIVQISALRHPNVFQKKNVIPGAVTWETTMQRVHMWTRPLSPGEQDGTDCFTVPDFLSGEKVIGLDGKHYPPLEAGSIRKIIEPTFSYMVLGEYPAQGVQQLISEEWVSKARSRWDLYTATFGELPPTNVRPIMGFDLAEYGNDSNVVAFRYGNYVPRLKTWAGIDVDMSTKQALKMYLEHNAQMAMVDATGVGSSVAPSMARLGRTQDVRSVSVKVGEKPTGFIKSELGEFQLLKDQLWWAMREWLRTDEAMLPPEPMLLEELKAVTYEVTIYGKIKITPKDQLRERIKRSPDRAEALALTFAPFERARWLKLDL